jgi:hypothetical protein
LAIKPRDNETFYREVDEELRKDQMTRVFQRFGWWIIGGVVLLLAAIAGYLWWQNNREAKAAEKGEALVGVLEDLQGGQRQKAAAPINQLAASDVPAYRAAGLFSRANLAIEANNLPLAMTTLGQIAGDQSLPEPYRNAALVRQTALQYDSLPPAAVVQRLRPLVRAGSAWFGSAGEMVAIAHLRMNRPDLAAPIFSAIAADDTVPPSIRSRAVQMAGALGVDAVQQSPATGGARPGQSRGAQPPAGQPQPQAPAAQPAPVAPPAAQAPPPAAPGGGAATKGQSQ